MDGTQVSIRKCPFCGGEAFVNDDIIQGDGGPETWWQVWVGCSSCGGQYRTGRGHGLARLREVAVKCWNLRTALQENECLFDDCRTNTSNEADTYCSACRDFANAELEDDHETT